MAIGAAHQCRCGVTVQPGRRCARCEATRQQQVDERRGTATERGYGAAWRRATALWRAEQPERNLCVECMARGIVKYGLITDHIRPHKGDFDKFWDRSNWQALCVKHHSSKTAREDGGFNNPITSGAKG